MALFGVLSGFGGTINPCGEGAPAITVNIYIGSCVYEQICTYDYGTTLPTVSCNTDGNAPLPEPVSTTRTVRRHLPCGSTCCKTTYELCRILPGDVIKIRKVGSSVQLGACDPAPAGVTCIPICNQ